MEKRVEQLGYDVAFNPPGDPGDGDCFYASAAKALGIETQGLKKVIFDFLKSHQFDVSIQPIVNPRPSTLDKNLHFLCNGSQMTFSPGRSLIISEISSFALVIGRTIFFHGEILLFMLLIGYI